MHDHINTRPARTVMIVAAGSETSLQLALRVDVEIEIEPARAHGWKTASGYIFKRAKGRNEGHVCNRGSIVLSRHILPPFRNIRCFSFVK
jgi:hypothetical protein